MGSDRDMREFEELRKVLSDPGSVLDSVSASLAEEAVGLIQEGFRTETDPYGRRWKPKAIADGRKTLSGRTNRLKSGWHVTRQTRDEFTIAPAVEYAEYHQEGTGIHGPKKRRIEPRTAKALRFPGPGGKPIFAKSVAGVPQRMMVPSELMGLPPAWEERFNEAATDALAESFRGDGAQVSRLRKRLGIDALVGFKVA